ncbi:hypothetical protein [Sideroxydans sp.]
MNQASSETYGFNLNSLEVGDILLSFGEDKKPKQIAKATGGPFSHAMLYVGHSVIHATTDGVYSKNPQRLKFEAVEHIGVIRAKRKLNEQEKDRLCTYARSWVGALYSVPEAGATLMFSKSNKLATVAHKQFCSRLVAQAYASIGISLVRNPNYCSPNDLLRSQEVETIKDCVKKLSSAEIELADSHDYNLELQSATFTWLTKVRDLAVRRNLGKVTTQNDVGLLLIKHPGFDKVVSRYMIDSGYLNYIRVDRIKNSYRYSPEAFLLLCANEAISVIKLLEQEQKSIDSDLRRRQQDVVNAHANSSAHQFQYFALAERLSRDLLGELECRQHTLDEVRALMVGA